MMQQRDGSGALPDSATGVGIAVSLEPRAALITPRFACLGTMMSPGLIAISEWRTVRPKRAQPLAEPQFLGFGRVSWVHQPTRADLWGVNRTAISGSFPGNSVRWRPKVHVSASD